MKHSVVSRLCAACHLDGDVVIERKGVAFHCVCRRCGATSVDAGSPSAASRRWTLEQDRIAERLRAQEIVNGNG